MCIDKDTCFGVQNVSLLGHKLCLALISSIRDLACFINFIYLFYLLGCQSGTSVSSTQLKCRAPLSCLPVHVQPEQSLWWWAGAWPSPPHPFVTIVPSLYLITWALHILQLCQITSLTDISGYISPVPVPLM